MEDIFKNHKWSIIGACIGLVLALLLLTIGFLKTILLLIFMIAGFVIGGYAQRSGLIDNLKKQVQNKKY